MSYYTFKSNTPKLNTVEVVAACVIAYEQNGNKIEKNDSNEVEATEWTFAIPACTSNKTIARALLKDAGITQAAKDKANEMIDYLKNANLMKVLTGKFVSPFEKDMLALLEQEEVESSRIGMLVYVPQLYIGGQARDMVTEVTVEHSYTSQALGVPGQKVELVFTLLEKRYIQKMDCHAAYGTDAEGNLVSFLTKHEHLCASQRLVGKVKSAGNDPWHNNALVTSLNFVKALDAL